MRFTHKKNRYSVITFIKFLDRHFFYRQLNPFLQLLFYVIFLRDSFYVIFRKICVISS